MRSTIKSFGNVVSWWFRKVKISIVWLSYVRQGHSKKCRDVKATDLPLLRHYGAMYRRCGTVRDDPHVMFLKKRWEGIKTYYNCHKTSLRSLTGSYNWLRQGRGYPKTVFFCMCNMWIVSYWLAVRIRNIRKFKPAFTYNSPLLRSNSIQSAEPPLRGDLQMHPVQPVRGASLLVC